MGFNKFKFIDNIEKLYLKQNIPKIEVGDTVKIGILIQEGNKERVQFSEGVIIAIHKAKLNTTITLRKILQGVGVEKVYLVNSPRITHMQIMRKSKVKKAKLYYLRNKVGKATRLKQKFTAY